MNRNLSDYFEPERDKKLTPKQELFCKYYVSNGHNGTQAAISAGYSKKTARTVANENLTKPDILAKIKSLEKPIISKLEIDENWVISKLKAFSDAKITDYFSIINGNLKLNDLNELTDAQLSAIALIRQGKDGTISIKLVDKKSSVVDLGKHIGMFKEMLEGNFNHTHEAKVYIIPAFNDEIDNGQE